MGCNGDDVFPTSSIPFGVPENDSSFGSLQALGSFRKLCQVGRLNEALQIVDLMDRQRIHVSATILYFLVQGCINMRDVIAGRELHCLIMKSNLKSNIFLGGHLIRMFALCGSLLDANRAFHMLPKLNVFAWTAIILAHAKLGHGAEVIKLYCQMQQSNIMPNEHTFVPVLKACSSIEALDEGQLVHAHAIKNGFESNISVGNTLISMHAKCGSLCDACRVFERMPRTSLVTWNAIIAGYAQHSYGHKVLELYHQMQHGGFEPDSVTFVSVLQGCSCILNLDQGKKIYSHIIESDFEIKINVSNALINMYAKCGSVLDALRVFQKLKARDLVTWSAMIAGCVQQGHCTEALRLFEHMRKEEVNPDKVTFVAALKACCSIEALDQGKLVHAHIVTKGSESDMFVGSMLIDMYAKCGSLEDACMVFETLVKQNVVTWSAMIGGYAHHGHGKEALQCFQEMQRRGIKPNTVTFASTLKACSNIGLLDQGRYIHGLFISCICEVDTSVVSALVGMYVKCGSLEDAHVVFNGFHKHSVGAWTAIIAGYALYNGYPYVLESFERMQRQGLKPNDVTFACILSACSHMGLLEKGCCYFTSIREEHSILLTNMHYNCMIDLLGRIGLLNEAESLLQTLPFPPDIVGWMSLLSHCRLHGDVDLGRRCFDNVLTVHDRHASGFVLMSNIYADAGMWKDSEGIQEMRSLADAHKKAGKAFVEIDNQVHAFLVGDNDHPDRCDIYEKLNLLSLEVKKKGYVPHLDLL